MTASSVTPMVALMMPCLLGRIADMSRLECVRETLRLALDFLVALGGPEYWEPWHGRYAERNPEELRNASAGKLASCMEKTRVDMRDVLDKVEAPALIKAEGAGILN